MRDAHFTRERPAPDGMFAADHAGARCPDDDYRGRLSGGEPTTTANLEPGRRRERLGPLSGDDAPTLAAHSLSDEEPGS